MDKIDLTKIDFKHSHSTRLPHKFADMNARLGAKPPAQSYTPPVRALSQKAKIKAAAQRAKGRAK